MGLSILTEENIFVKNDSSAILDGLATIVKRSNGKIREYVTIIDPTILVIAEQESNELGLFEKLKEKKVGTVLNNIGLSISILRRGKKVSVLVGKQLLKLAVY